MPFDIAAAAGNAAISTGTGFLGGLLGQVFAKKNDKRQLEMQGKLNQMALASNKDMVNYNMQNQMELWEKTNYAAQKEQLEKAGLNPGLLYGMSGGGGATTNAAQGSGVSAGNAPSGGGEIMAMTMMGMQQQLIQAQIQKTKAETGNIQADTANKPLTGQNIQASTASLTQGIENAKALQKLTEIQTDLANINKQIQGATIGDQINQITNTAEKSAQEIELLANQNLINQTTAQNKIQIIKQEAISAMLRNEAIKSGIAVNEAQIQKMSADITQRAQEITISSKGQDVRQKEYELMKYIHDATDREKISFETVKGILQIVVGAMTK